MGSLVAVASTRPRDPATGRFISAEAAARVSAPAAPPVVTEPAPVTTKDKKKQEKQQQDKKKSKNKKSSKKKSDKKKKKKRRRAEQCPELSVSGRRLTPELLGVLGAGSITGQVDAEPTSPVAHHHGVIPPEERSGHHREPSQ